MSTGVADIMELDIHQDPGQGEDDGNVQEEGGGGTGGAQGPGQLVGMLPQVPVQPTNVPKVNDITYAPLVAVIKDIGEF